MKIVEETAVSKNELKERINAVKKDLSILLNVENYEDIKDVEWNYMMWNKDIDRNLKKGMSFDDIIDRITDYVSSHLSKLKQEYKSRLDTIELLKSISSKLSDKYNLIESGEEYAEFSIPEGSTQDDNIEFVDNVVALSKGRYYATGRGGSWTAWNILTPYNTELKAGRRNNNYFVEIVG